MDYTAHNSQEPTKLSKKCLNKLRRREGKAKHLLLKHEDIEITDQPTMILYISNAGIGNGISREHILEWLQPFATLRNIHLQQSKPFAFVETHSISDAKLLATLSGSNVLHEGKEEETEHFIHFVTRVPSYCEMETILPAGLKLIEDIITKDTEFELLACLNWECSARREEGRAGQMKHRDVLHFGYEFKYATNNVDPEEPLSLGIPSECKQVIEKLQALGHLPWEPEQLTVNRYQPGQGIPSHVDTHSAFLDPIVSLSLGSAVSMTFTRPDGYKTSIRLPRRSALVMSGESRYHWNHGIIPRKSDVVDTGDGLTLIPRETRTSFTLRRLRRGPCNCKYPEQCDSRNYQAQDGPDSHPSKLISEDIAGRLEQLHVHQVYDQIASHFSGTRHSQWPQVAHFISTIPQYSIVADIGCGNGKYLTSRPDLYMLGVERSINLCTICQERRFHIVQGDVLSIPLLANACDACLCIAVIHHLSTEARRLASIKELVRILKPGGRCLIYVWAMEQRKSGAKSNYLKPNDEPTEMVVLPAQSTDCSLPVHKNRTEFKSNDMFVPWNLKLKQSVRPEDSAEQISRPTETPSSNLYHRYYHIFKQGELEELCLKVDEVEIERSYYDQGNWCVIIYKNK